MFNLNIFRKGLTIVDVWDIIAILGFGAIVAGVYLIYLPAALIVFGSGLLYAYYLRESSHVSAPRDSSEGEPDERE